MYDAGFKNIWNVDVSSIIDFSVMPFHDLVTQFSSVLIEKMSAKHAGKRPEMKCMLDSLYSVPENQLTRISSRARNGRPLVGIPARLV
jgi:hypothetical protein